MLTVELQLHHLGQQQVTGGGRVVCRGGRGRGRVSGELVSGDREGVGGGGGGGGI